MNCNVKITAEGTADGLEVSIHGGSVGMMTAAELIVARVLMAVADDEENLAGLKDSMFEIINEMVKDCWAEKYLRISGKTVEELAEEVGTSRSTMYYKLNGGSDMSVEMAIKVKAALGAEESIEKLFARSDEPEKQEGEAHDAET